MTTAPTTPSQRFHEIRTVAAVLYTHSTRIAGCLRSVHWRFSDTLNALDQDFVQVHDALLQPLHASKGDDLSTTALLTHKDHIVLALPRESPSSVEVSPACQRLRAQREALRVIMEVPPFTLEGMVHLSPGFDLLQYVHDPHQQFMPMTDVVVTYHPAPLLSFKATYLLVNRRNIEVVLDTALIGQRPEPEADTAQPNILDMELDNVRAAELLLTTPLFKKVDVAKLQQLCLDLCESGLMGRRVCRADVEVFQQGDTGDTLYIVESGKLEAVVTHQPSDEEHYLAYFSPGDFFGEMAILGERRRTATVRTLTEVSLLAVHQEAVQMLMRKFPCVTTSILSVMLERQASLEVARKRPPRPQAVSQPKAAKERRGIRRFPVVFAAP